MTKLLKQTLISSDTLILDIPIKFQNYQVWSSWKPSLGTKTTYVSVNSKPDHSAPWAKSGESFFEWANSPSPQSQRKWETQPLGRKSRAKTPFRAIIFKNPANTTKYDTEIMKLSSRTGIQQNHIASASLRPTLKSSWHNESNVGFTAVL